MLTYFLLSQDIRMTVCWSAWLLVSKTAMSTFHTQTELSKWSQQHVNKFSYIPSSNRLELSFYKTINVSKMLTANELLLTSHTPRLGFTMLESERWTSSYLHKYHWIIGSKMFSVSPILVSGSFLINRHFYTRRNLSQQLTEARPVFISSL